MQKTVWNDPSEWSIFENTHEPIIDQETFDIVQRIRDGRRRLTPIGEMPILSGMLFCADCGAKLYQVRSRGWKHEQEYFTCASYRKGQGLCSPHQIHNVQVEEILLRQLKSITAYARSHEAEFVELVTKQNEKELNRLMRSSSKDLGQAKERIKKLDSIMQRLYEDNLDGKYPTTVFPNVRYLRNRAETIGSKSLRTGGGYCGGSGATPECRFLLGNGAPVYGHYGTHSRDHPLFRGED